MKRILPSLIALFATSAFAEGARELDAHEHGVGEMNIAIDGDVVAIELHAPGADIVGFEYEANSTKDRAAIDAAVAMLAKPLELFVLPAAAECSVTKASAGLESEENHEEAGHEEEDHEEDGHNEDGHEDHAEGETHDDHAEARHTEFHAEYLLTCGMTDALTRIDFAYFSTFENALELEVQILSASGAKAFEVERDAPTLDLRGMF